MSYGQVFLTRFLYEVTAKYFNLRSLQKCSWNLKKQRAVKPVVRYIIAVLLLSPAQPAFGSGHIAPGTMPAVYYSYCRSRHRYQLAGPGRTYGQNCVPENQNSLMRLYLVASLAYPSSQCDYCSRSYAFLISVSSWKRSFFERCVRIHLPVFTFQERQNSSALVMIFPPFYHSCRKHKRQPCSKFATYPEGANGVL